MALIYFILILGIVVFIHELGHLLVAKMFNVYCSEFALGFGPILISWQGKETRYSLRMIPLGGFVQMAGEEGTDDFDVSALRTIKGIAHWKRILVMLAGIFMNLVLAWLLLTSIFMMTQERVEPPIAAVGGIVEQSPAQKAGLQVGDIITKIEYADGTVLEPKTFQEMATYSPADPSQPMTYTIKRQDTTLTVQVTAAYVEEADRYQIGIQSPAGEVVPLTFFQQIQYGFIETITFIKQVFVALLNLFRGIGLNQLSGPLGIMKTTGDYMSMATGFKEGLVMFFSLTASISINVGLFNLLPIPAFDGGRVLLTVAEMIKGSPLNKKWEERLIMGSMLLLLMLFVFVMWKDILKIF